MYRMFKHRLMLSSGFILTDHSSCLSVLIDWPFPGERPGELAAEHPADVLQSAAGPLPGDHRAGERAGAGKERAGHAAAAPQSAPQYQNEAGARDHHVPTSAGAGGGQVRAKTRLSCR